MRFFLLISLMFLSIVVRAESTNNDLVQFKISSLQLFSSFSSFTYFQGDERNRARLFKAKDQANRDLARLENPEAVLVDKWNDVIAYVERYESFNFDGGDMGLEVSWSILRREFNIIIDPLIAQKMNPIDVLKINMEIILSQYMGYANSTTGGYNVSSSEESLEKKIESFTQSLQKFAKTDDKFQPLNKKWGYINGTLAAYNSNVAPFVVLYTYDSMRKMIASL